MKAFSDFGITINRRFEGERLRIEKLEGDNIVVTDFKIEDSKYKPKEGEKADNEKALVLYFQVEYRNELRLVWGNYKFLTQQFSKMTLDMCPFTAKLVNENGWIMK